MVIDVTPKARAGRMSAFASYGWRRARDMQAAKRDGKSASFWQAARATISAGKLTFGAIGGRETVFDGRPYRSMSLRACVMMSRRYARRTGNLFRTGFGAQIGASDRGGDDVGLETRGSGTNLRFVRQHPARHVEYRGIAPCGGSRDARRTLVEHPPHKHDTDAWPHETQLEETYWHRTRHAKGFAFQRVYTDDHSLDEAMTIEDSDVVLVPRGYHPVEAAHGHDLYYLNVMAAARRMWRFTEDSAFR